ncbi:MAG: flavodoxin domain-containing protein [Verrucomicrobiota bacterium]
MASSSPPFSAESARILILCGPQAVHAADLARSFHRRLSHLGYQASVSGIGDYRKSEQKSDFLLVICSSAGEHAPPEDPLEPWKVIEQSDAPTLEGVQFSILALEDSNRENLSGIGKFLEARFEALGGKRFVDRTECGADDGERAATWCTSVEKKLQELLPAPSTTAKSSPLAKPRESEGVEGYGKKNPFPAPLKVHRSLCGEGSPKDTRHFEIGLTGSGLTYEVGDSLAVIPKNDPAYVDRLLGLLHLSGEETVLTPKGASVSLRAALEDHYTITGISRKFFGDFGKRSQDSSLQDLLLPDFKKDLSRFLAGRELIDLFLLHPTVRYTADEFVGLLSKLAPRLYSIASSLKKHPDEVHLTVARVGYESHGIARKGVCSTFLSDRVRDGEQMGVFVQPAKGFKPPTDPHVPMIMVGPGTGIAPFRAFLEEREITEAPGENWLFFGNPHEKSDYFYQEEFEAWQESGLLNRLDLAWSRDQGTKVYVQHKIAEQADELWEWIRRGAHFYVCGDAISMAKDVDQALHDLIASRGSMSPEAAVDYVKQMKKDKRYQRDVY